MCKQKLIGAIVALSTVGLMATTYAEITTSADLRVREEYIDQDGKDGRNRMRIRGRVKLAAEINETLSGAFRLATGGGDPVSRNQSFDGAFSSKNFGLDQAYLDWAPAGGSLSFTGGKIPNPMIIVKDLVWDGDVTPEGVNVNFSGGEGVPLEINSGYYVVEERSSADETTLWGSTITTELAGLNLGIGYFLYDNIKGQGPVFGDDALGNSTMMVGEGDDAKDVLANDYGIFEVGASYGADLGGMPGKIYADYVVNNDADTDGDTGYQIGVGIGKAKAPGSWSLDLNYRELEADAVFATFADSDNGGGGTDHEGWKLSGKYQVAKNLQAAFAYFMNSVDPDGIDADYNRLQLDLIAKF
ncbi:MAG: hypothetical protein ACI9TH_003672 [Kiritimatiellia bacterium]|jgi:hypothetical protein